MIYHYAPYTFCLVELLLSRKKTIEWNKCGFILFFRQIVYYMFCHYSFLSLKREHLSVNSLLDQVPTPYLILGDFNDNFLCGHKQNNLMKLLLQGYMS